MTSTQIDFFDHLASDWDKNLQEQDYQVAELIVKRGNIQPQMNILDVGCGTGVMIPALVKAGIQNYQGVDRSTNMSAMLKNKFPTHDVLVADFERRIFDGESFDRIIIYNAFPHFSNFRIIFTHSHYYLKSGGQLIIAHSLNRQALNLVHSQANAVANDILPSNEEIFQYYAKAGFINIDIDDSIYFYASGTKQNLI